MGLTTRQEQQTLTETLRRLTQFRPVTDQGIVSVVERDSNQRATHAHVDLRGTQVRVVLSGQGVRVGDAIEIQRERASAAGGEWSFRRYIGTLAQAPLLDESADIPAPTWGAPPLTTSAASATDIFQGAFVFARLTETPERFGPGQMEIAYGTDSDVATGFWSKTTVKNEGGQDALLTVRLGTVFPWGVTINVRARTITNTGASSPWSDIRSITTATNATVPTAPNAFSVDLTKQFTAIISMGPRTLPLVFQYWEVSVATTSGGAGAVSYQSRSDQFIFTGPIGNIFIRVREVSQSGQVSGWFPAANWNGPYTIIAGGDILDTTPPTVPNLVSAVATTQLIQGRMMVVVTSTLAAYTPPVDFERFEFRHSINDGATVRVEFWSSTDIIQVRYDAVQGATITIDVRAVDKLGNASAFSNQRVVTTPLIVAPPTPGAAPVLVPAYKGAIITWTATPSNATNGQIIGYEVQRAPDSGGAPGTWTTLVTVDGTRWVDAGQQAAAIVLWYRYRPINSAGTPAAAFSPAASVTTLAVATADIAANAITANLIAANAITADKLAAQIILASKEIATGAGGVIRSSNNGVRIDDQGIEIRGEAIELRDLAGNVDGYIGGGAPTGIFLRLESGRAYVVDLGNVTRGNVIDPDLGLYGGVVDAWTTPAYQYGTQVWVRTAANLGFTRAGRFVACQPGNWINLSGVASTQYLFSPSDFNPSVPSSGVYAWLLRGYFNIANGQRAYVYPPNWGIEAGVSVAPQAGNAIDIQPSVIAAAQAGGATAFGVQTTASFTGALLCIGFWI